MTTVRDYLKKVKTAQSNILDEQEKSVVKNENKIIQMNTAQISEGMGADDKILKNRSNVYKGVYTLSTQMINPNKQAGDLYTFYETGNFFSGFEANITSDLNHVNIFSTGTGTSEKAMFFNGYTNLFGLNKNNEYKLNYEIILPDLLKFLNQTL